MQLVFRLTRMHCSALSVLAFFRLQHDFVTPWNEALHRCTDNGAQPLGTTGHITMSFPNPEQYTIDYLPTCYVNIKQWSSIETVDWLTADENIAADQRAQSLIYLNLLEGNTDPSVDLGCYRLSCDDLWCLTSSSTMHEDEISGNIESVVTNAQDASESMQ